MHEPSQCELLSVGQNFIHWRSAHQDKKSRHPVRTTPNNRFQAHLSAVIVVIVRCATWLTLANASPLVKHSPIHMQSGLVHLIRAGAEQARVRAAAAMLEAGEGLSRQAHRKPKVLML